MTEYIYTVSDNNVLLGSFEDIEVVAIFVKAYFAEYYNEQFKLTIQRVPKNREERADDRN